MKNILFVCSGNTCRSPMAQCLFTAALHARGITDICAISAGVCANGGAPASIGALRAMQRRGLSLQAHRSQPVTAALLARSALVVGMSSSHIETLRTRFPTCAVPMVAFDDPPISDPFGGDDAAYERAARDIERQLPALTDSLQASCRP